MLAARPELRSAAEAAPILAQYIGETDREVFAVALLTVRHRVLGVHTVSVGCLTASLVHPREKSSSRRSSAEVPPSGATT